MDEFADCKKYERTYLNYRTVVFTDSSASVVKQKRKWRLARVQRRARCNNNSTVAILEPAEVVVVVRVVVVLEEEEAIEASRDQLTSLPFVEYVK